MYRAHDLRAIARSVAFAALTLCLTVAVVLAGGVDPVQWQWLAAVISLASWLFLAAGSTATLDRTGRLELGSLGLLLLWMLLQLVPLPPALVAFLSPLRWSTAFAASIATGADPGSWLPLSVAPAATFERLLKVAPAMAVFVAAREMGRWWGGRRLWVVAAPVIAVAFLESLLGLSQFYSAVQTAASDHPSVRGTYVNRNHFAGLLELALPLAIMWALAIWNNASKHRKALPVDAAIRISALLVIAACLLAAVSASFSRMGFIASLAAIAVVVLGWLLRRQASRTAVPRWFWLLPVVLPVLIFAFLSTDAMVLRFAETPGVGQEMSPDGRVQIWKETIQLIGAYRWTGTGLGAYEYGLYPFRNFATDLTADFAHNDYLQIMAELGPIGAVFAMVVAILILWRPLSVFLQLDSRHWELAVGLIGSFVAIGLHSIVDFNLYIPANALAVAWLGGVAVSPGLRET